MSAPLVANQTLGRRMSRRGVLAGTTAVLVGCATDKPIVVDHAAMAAVRRIGLPTVGFPADPTVKVMNTFTNRLGLVGVVAEGIIRTNRGDAVRAMLAAHTFDPQAHFQVALVERLRARKLAVAPEAADPARRAFLAKYEAVPDCDAVLDIFVVGYGFLALDDHDASPFRPTVVLSTRLVQAADRSVMMQDMVAVNGVEGATMPPGDTSPLLPTFKDFAEIEANPGRAVASLRAALSAAADGVGRRLA